MIAGGADAFYTDAQRAMQRDQGREALADTVFAAIVADALDEMHAGFIESRDFFFLATVDGTGMPTTSHKGGPVGVARVDGPRALSFPSYDGNGMYKSMGNVIDTGKVGLLFIDLETPNRIRVQGTASVSKDPDLVGRWPGAKMAVTVAVEQVFLNCARYIHKHVRVSDSPYVPAEDGTQPYPAWKRIDLVQPALSDEERARAQANGGTIDFDGYAKRLMDGES
jgi:predicted pyridoxine 5'-phosphate oxidase superfamily flavin-nucleotide-binding protein